MAMTLYLGLTGGIACGKSNISNALRELGAVIIDGDVLSRQLTAPAGAALPGIRERFGDEVFHPDGTLDRKALGRAVFGHPQALQALQALDGLMQPLLRDMILAGMAKAAEEGAPVCVLDMPLLYEKQLDSLCDRVWCAYIPREEQLRRLMERDGCDQAAAEARLASQMDPAEKAARADVVIHTDGTPEETRALIPDLYEKELARRSS